MSNMRITGGSFTAPANNGAAITPNDSANLPTEARSLYWRLG